MDRFLKIEEVMALVQRGRSAIYADIKTGKFPAPIQIGTNASRWRESDLEVWADGLRRGIRRGTSKAAA